MTVRHVARDFILFRFVEPAVMVCSEIEGEMSVPGNSCSLQHMAKVFTVLVTGFNILDILLLLYKQRAYVILPST